MTKLNENTELLPCPFCGCKDIELMQDTSSDYEKNWSWFIGCTSCDAEFAVCSTEKQCIEKWNTRAEPQCQQVRPLAEFGDEQIDAELKIGKWLSAALDDEDVCAEMKLDIVNWFTYLEIRNNDKSSRNQVISALNNLLDRYTGLVNCGDCGSWNPEEEKEVIEARKVIEGLKQ